MGQTTDHALGRSRKNFVKAEATFATFVKPAATDAIKTLRPIKFDAKQERVDREDNRNTRDVLERITKGVSVSWDLEAYLLPSGSAGTAPDLGPLLKIALGSETVSGGVSVTYGLNNVQALGSVSLIEEMNTISYEAAAGAWVEEVGLKVSGKQEARLTFAGGAAKYGRTTYCTLASGVATAATSMTITSGEERAIQIGTVVKIGNDSNSSAGYEITAMNYSTRVATFTPGLAGAGESGGAAVTAFAPSETTAGSPTSPTLGSMTIDAVSVPVVEFEWNLKNGIKPIDDEAGQANVTDYIPGFREVSGTFTLRGRRDHLLHLGKRWSFSTRALIVAIGTAAGRILTVNVPTAEIEFAPTEGDPVEEIMMNFPWKALGSSGEDSTTLVFT